MTGYRDEDSTYRSFDIETVHIDEIRLWKCRVYKNGKLYYITENKKKKEAYRKAKIFIDLWNSNSPIAAKMSFNVLVNEPSSTVVFEANNDQTTTN